MGYAKEWLTQEEWKAMLNQDLSWRDELLLKTTYRGALRISEALGLQYPYHYRREEDNGFIVLEESKTEDDPEQVPVGLDIVKETERFMRSEQPETNFVFRSRQDSSMSRQRAYQIVNEVGSKAGVDKKLGTHTLRRSRAKHLLDEGVDLSVVSGILRHSDIKTTMEYLKIAKKRQADLMKQVDEANGL